MMAVCLGRIKKQRVDDHAHLGNLRNQLSFVAIVPQLLALEMLTKPSKTNDRTNEPFGIPGLSEDLENTLHHAFVPHQHQEESLPLVQRFTPFQLACITIASWFVVWVVWSMITRGGISLKLMGIDLQQSQGKRAGPFRCGWRTMLVWTPFFALILISVWLQNATNAGGHQTGPWLYWIPWWLALIYLAAAGLFTLIWPRRGLQDRLSGVYLMPR